MFAAGIMLILALSVCLMPGLANSQPSVLPPVSYLSQDYVLDRWTIEDGLPVNSIKQVYQSSDGYIWVITYDGIVRFDGLTFTNFDTGTHPELPGNRFQTMYETPDGRLWFETEESHILLSLDDNTFKQWGPETGMAGFENLAFHKRPDGAVLIGTESGISLYKNGTMELFEPDVINGRVDRIFADSDSTFFFRHNHLISRYSDGKITILNPEPQMRRPYHPFVSMPDGSTYFGADQGLFRYIPGDDLQHVWELQLDDEKINALYVTGKNSLLASTSVTGFWEIIFDGTEASITLITPYEEGILGMPSDLIFSTINNEHWMIANRALYRDGEIIFRSDDRLGGYLHDREGSIWVGTYSSGLYRLKKNPFKTISLPEGMSDRNTYPILETLDGQLLAGTMFGGLNIIHPDGNITHSGSGSQIRALHQTKDGTILVGRNASYVYEYTGDELVHWNPDPDFVPHTIHAIFEQEEDSIFVGSNSGLFQFKNGTWVNLTEELNLPEHAVRYFAPAPDGSLWMATAGSGIYRLDRNSNITIFNMESELPANLVRSLFIESKSGTENYIVLVGSEDRGLIHANWNAETQKLTDISHLRQADGLPDNTIHQILFDGIGNYWMSTNAGIAKIETNSLHDWASGLASEPNITIFTEQDGMRNREGNGGMQPAGLVRSDGSIVFPTQDGIVFTNPDHIRGNEIPPPVKIEHLLASGGLMEVFPADITLEADQRNFEIKYAGLSYLVPDKVTFRYKLDGFDDDWNEAGTRRTAYYTNLNPGTYQFQVLALNNDGVLSTEPATATISIQPYFYETGWFKLFLLLLFAGVVYAGVQARLNRMKKVEVLLRKEVEQRTAELKKAKEISETQAQELLDVDRAKSRFFANVSHEFRTPLTLILGPLEELTEKEERPDVKEKLLMIQRNGFRLQRLTDQILDLVRLESGNLKPNITKNNLVGQLLAIVDMFLPLGEKTGIEIEFHSEADNPVVFADTEMIEHVVANLLSNAIKFTPPGGRIKVYLSDTEHNVQLSITDSGRGIKEDQLDKIFNRFYQAETDDNRQAEGMGIGLALSKELVLLHQGKIWVESIPGKGSVFHVLLKKGTKHFAEAGYNLTMEKEYEPNTLEMAPNAINTKPAATQPANSSKNGNIPSSPNKDCTTVLVVEDHSDIRDFISSILSDTYRVVVAVHGADALKKIQKNPPDIIVADVMMPEMDGFTLNKALKSDPLSRNIPLLFLTARSGQDDELRGLADGADDYLSKPFKPEILKARIHSLLSSRQRLKERILTEEAANNINTTHNLTFIERVSFTIAENLGSPDFNVDRMAELMNTDRSQLYRKIKKETGQTPQQILTKARMQRARQLIDEGENNFSEIAYACGFNSLSYFSRTFKKFYGIPPSAVEIE